MDVLKVGVVGAGHMGKIHGKLLHSLPMFDFQGFYDPAAQASDSPSPILIPCNLCSMPANA